MDKSDKLFPFANISNRELFLDFTSTQMQACSKNNFQQLKYKDYKFNSFYNAVNMSCEYYTEGQFSNNLKNCIGVADTILKKYELCVTQINATLDIVAVSETWLADSDSGNLYELKDYTSAHIPRK